MRKILLSLLFSLTSSLLPLTSLPLRAQSESGMRFGADVSYDISKRWGAEVGFTARLEEDATRFTTYDVGAGLDYKPLKWLKIGAGYGFIRDYGHADGPTIVFKKDPASPDGIKYNSNGYPVVNGYNYDEAYWRTKHRFYFDLTEKWKWGRFAFSLRERYQMTHYTSVEGVEYKYREELEEADLEGYTKPYMGPVCDEYGDPYWYGLDRVGDKGTKQKHYFRTRLGIEYNIKNVPATPFVSYELTNNLGEGFDVVRHRAQAGVDVRLTKNKRNFLSLSYIYQHGAQEEVGNNDLHIVAFGYKFKFASAKAQASKKKHKK